MNAIGPVSESGIAAMQAIIERPQDTLIGVDFDGTLAPIIDDPAQAYADPAAVAALGRLGKSVGAIVVITGRPAETAVALGGFRGVPGLESMVVLGQYGVERWDAATDQFSIPPEPESMASVEKELPGIFEELGLSGVRVEHKGRAIGVHTRELGDSTAAFDRLAEPLGELAAKYGLLIEPGKNVLEIRAPGIDKGEALRNIVAEKGARQVVFAGDDLGDLPAFRAVEQLRTEGVAGLLVCSASHEEDALTQASDLILDGPGGVAQWLTRLADSLEAKTK
ncbi:MAG: trehalose 6-phosphate phosphatase [Propionibacteriaceae bacterium]|jgi:trehalose 6-phosphate phosphatase|nr:otsB [Propionibacteriaceae bacterium]MDX6322677.1 trehalose 6-phosphate phosphatase [Propionibacteriaceae bacterium]